MTQSVRIHPTPTLQGTISVPGDKSISHRAIMLSAIAEGTSQIEGLLMGEDVLCTIDCFRQMGVSIEIDANKVTVHGVGMKGLTPPAKTLYCGNSGTTLRLMIGLLAAQPFESRLTGDASLNRRPIERVAQPLRQMGGMIEEYREGETERVVRIVGRPLKGISYHSPVASAQVKSAILLAGLFAYGDTEIEEPASSRDHSELMLASRGTKIHSQNNKIKLSPTPKLTAQNMKVPGDISSAAFFIAAGLIGKKSKIILKNVGINPTRTGILDAVSSMGGNIQRKSESTQGGEAVCDLWVDASELSANSIHGDLIPRLIDEIPVLSMMATFAKGTTQFKDAAELRVKESDRIAAMERELTKFGAKIKTFSDGIEITGPTIPIPNEFESGGDHRVAMTMIIGATQGKASSIIRDIECINTSYPTFFEDLKQLGGSVDWV